MPLVAKLRFEIESEYGYKSAIGNNFLDIVQSVFVNKMQVWIVGSCMHSAELVKPQLMMQERGRVNCLSCLRLCVTSNCVKGYK